MIYYWYDGKRNNFSLDWQLIVYDIISPKNVRGSQAYFKIHYFVRLSNRSIEDDYNDTMNKGSMMDANSVRMKKPEDFEFVIKKLFQMADLVKIRQR